MSKLTTFLLLISFVALSNGVKFSKKKYKKSGILEAQAKLKELKPLLAQAKADVAQIQACAALAPNDPTRDEVCPEVEDRTTITTANNVMVSQTMYLNSGDRCGPQTLTNCGRLHDMYALGTATKNTNQNTNTGSCFHTAPTNGIYRLCFHARFKQGGNAGDVTVQAGGTTYAAAFGDGDQRDWRSTGQCFYQQLSTANSIYMSMRSGGSSDCVQETSWRYGIQSVTLVIPLT